MSEVSMPASESRGKAPSSATRRGRAAQTADVARAWTARTLKARYQQSTLGWTWAVIQPVATVAIFTVVFTRIVHVDTAGVPYVLFSYAAVVPWALLANALPDMSMSLVNNLNLVTKIYFPREALPLASLAARVVDFGIGLVLLMALVVAFGIPPSPVGLAFLPVVLLVQVTLLLGLGLGCAALNVFYRDVDPVVRLALQIWFYASPVIYPVALVPERWRTAYFLNPMAGVIESYRDVLLAGRAPGWYLLVAGGVSAAVLVAGYGFFTRAQDRFADLI